jgi:hypothetical protein
VTRVLDTKHYPMRSRSWIFRSVGTSQPSGEEGHDEALRMVGYYGAISIEHEEA